MCFRPAEVAVSVECSGCGRKINPVNGNYPDSCPFCDLPLGGIEGASGSDAIPASGMPASPAPSVPTAPKPL